METKIPVEGSKMKKFTWILKNQRIYLKKKLRIGYLIIYWTIFCLPEARDGSMCNGCVRVISVKNVNLGKSKVESSLGKVTIFLQWCIDSRHLSKFLQYAFLPKQYGENLLQT